LKGELKVVIKKVSGRFLKSATPASIEKLIMFSAIHYETKELSWKKETRTIGEVLIKPLMSNQQ
jgi:hypothetical protein